MKPEQISGRNGASGRSWRVEPPDIPNSKISQTMDADVVVVGAGPAGVSAARSALEHGASVILLEAMTEKGYRVLPSEVGHINSQFGESKGAPRYDPMDLVHDMIRRSANRVNPTLIRQFAFESGNAMDWLLEGFDEEKKKKIEITFVDPPRKYSGSAYGYKSFIGTLFFRESNGVSFLEVMLHNLKQVRHLGGAIQFGTTAYKLIRNDHRVTGVMAQDRDGQFIRYGASKAVILAAGDFGGNPEMLRDLVPELTELLQDDTKHFRCFGRKGAGIQMGLWAGGRMDPAPAASLMGGVTKPGVAGPLGDTAFCYLNKEGKRFCAEGFGHINQALRQPKGELYAVWDSTWPEQLEYQPYDHGNIDLHYQNDANLKRLRSEMGAIRPGDPNGGIVHDTFKVVPEEYRVYAADTLEELADILGLTGQVRENFLISIVRYNGFCHDGFDSDFGKESSLLFPVEKGPFYCYKSANHNGFALAMCSGLFVDELNRVLDRKGEPIQGLMAVGNNAGGSFALNYTTPMSGCCCGSAVTLGRYCGKNAALL